MKAVVLLLLGWTAALQASVPATPAENVNSRYRIESYEVRGASEEALSRGLRDELRNLIGSHFDQRRVVSLSMRMKRELRAESVARRIIRGTEPYFVSVIFDVTPEERERFRLSLPKGLYHAKQGWTGWIEGTATLRSNGFSLGALSDGDALVERFAGWNARYDNERFLRSRLGVHFRFDDYHSIWNAATLDAAGSALDTESVYRSRRNYEPYLSFVLAEPLMLTVGASFQQMELQFPAARTESANAFNTALRYRKRFTVGTSTQHRVEAGYNLRAATRTLDSDFAYTRHLASVRYQTRYGNTPVRVHLQGGGISGEAPLFDRFILGNASTLRGWNKWEIVPLGASRMAHGSLEVGLPKALTIFYDSGAAWNGDQAVQVRNGVGVGLRASRFFLLVAFPVRQGGLDPVFMAGLDLDSRAAAR